MIESKDIRFQKKADLIGDLGQQGLRSDKGYRDFYKRDTGMVPDKSTEIALERTLERILQFINRKDLPGIPQDLIQRLNDIAFELEMYTNEGRQEFSEDMGIKGLY